MDSELASRVHQIIRELKCLETWTQWIRSSESCNVWRRGHNGSDHQRVVMFGDMDTMDPPCIAKEQSWRKQVDRGCVTWLAGLVMIRLG